MMSKTRITVLVENTAHGPGVLAEHGLAYWIEHHGKRILLDSGQGSVLASNAYKLKIPLYELDALVLSHGHYDHTGGAAEALKTDRPVTVYAHPAAFAQKFIRSGDGTAREIGIPFPSQEAIRASRNQWIATDRPTAVSEKGDSPLSTFSRCPPERPSGYFAQMGTVPFFLANGLTVTGPVPRLTDFEDTGGPFFLDEACTQPDPLEDDQSVFFDTTEGTVVLLGCAHSGVINTLHYIRQLTDNRPLYAVIGGMHLVGASSRRIERTIEELKQIGVRRLAPAHCTGMPATAALWTAFPGICITCHAGKTFEFEVA